MKPVDPRDIEKVPILREEPLVPSGIAVYAVILWLKQLKWDREKTLDLLEGAITRSDIEYAEHYYKEHRSEIDLKLTSL
jgi:hypothetical protein